MRTSQMLFIALGIATCASSANAANRKVAIINGTSSTMTSFYASNSGKNDWEEDILGRDVLAPGETVEIDINDGTSACVYDFRADFQNGETLTRERINVCEISEYRYSE